MKLSHPMARLSLVIASVLLATGVMSALRPLPVSAGQRQAAASPAAQVVQMYVLRGHNMPNMDLMGPDGKAHDAILPSTFAVKLGVPVRLEITNYDAVPHTLTAPGLGLNVLIKAGTAKGHMAVGLMELVTPTTTTITFTPKKVSVFRWYCTMPCDSGAKNWAMDQGFSGQDKEGFMAGFIVVMG